MGRLTFLVAVAMAGALMLGTHSTCGKADPPSRPSGPDQGTMHRGYTFSAHPSGGYLSEYEFEWGDGTSSDWVRPNESGIASASHSWKAAGAYRVRARGTEYGSRWSEWSQSTLIVVDTGMGHPSSRFYSLEMDYGSFGVAALPDTDRVLVTARDWRAVLTISIRQHEVSRRTHLTLEQPRGISASLFRDEAYVACAGGLGVLSAQGSLLREVTFGDSLCGVAVSPDGHRVFVTDEHRDRVYAFDPGADSVVGEAAVGDAPAGVCCLPGTGLVYCANSGDSTLTVMYAATLSVVDSVAVGAAPGGLASDGQTVYVTTAAGDLRFIRVSDNELVRTCPVGPDPAQVALTPDGKYAFVTCRGDSSVHVVRVEDGVDVQAIPVPAGPEGIAFTPDGGLALVASADAAQVTVLRW